MTDPYITLGVEKSASSEEIKIAFRKLAMQHHPDRNPDDPTAENKFKEISAAYEILSDPTKRAAHDSPQSDFGFNFHRHFGGGMPFEMEEILRNFGFSNQQQQPRNRHINTLCEISLSDALNGCEVNLHVFDKEIRVKIPVGVDDGTRIRVPGAGESVHTNQPAGDLFVTMQVRRHPTIDRDGDTLYSTATIDSFEAILGTSIKIKTLDGDEIQIDTPRELQPGMQITIAERGMPHINGNKRGDHIVTINVSTPKNLSDRQIKLLQEIRACNLDSDSISMNATYREM